MKKVIYLATLIFIVACSSKKVVPTAPVAVSPPTAFNPVMNRYPLLSEAEYSSPIKDFPYAEYVKGKSVYESSCNRCHDLKNPISLPTSVWLSKVGPMVDQYNLKFSDLIDATGVRLITGYLVTASTPKK